MPEPRRSRQVPLRVQVGMMTNDGPFSAYPKDSTVYIETYTRLRGSERVIHLMAKKVAKVGRKYLATDDGVRWVRLGIDDTRLIREDLIHSIRFGVGGLLFRETPELRFRLEREQEVVRLARMNTALEDEMLCKIAEEGVARRFVETILAKDHVSYIEIAQTLTHKRGCLTSEEIHTILGK